MRSASPQGLLPTPPPSSDQTCARYHGPWGKVPLAPPLPTATLQQAPPLAGAAGKSTATSAARAACFGALARMLITSLHSPSLFRSTPLARTGHRAITLGNHTAAAASALDISWSSGCPAACGRRGRCPLCLHHACQSPWCRCPLCPSQRRVRQEPGGEPAGTGGREHPILTRPTDMASSRKLMPSAGPCCQASFLTSTAGCGGALWWRAASECCFAGAGSAAGG
jgi:hypothetical protein